MKQISWWMFAGLCLLAGSEWLLTPLSLVVRGSVFAIVGVFAAVASRRATWSGGPNLWRLALAAVLLLGVPEVASGWAFRHISVNFGIAVFAMMPLLVVLVVVQWSTLNRPDQRHLMVPSLAGLGGVLLLVPVDIPSSTVERIAALMLLGAAVLVAIASVWLYRLLQSFRWLQALAIFCLANALVLLAIGVIQGSWWSFDAAWGALTGTMVVLGLQLVLLVGLLRRMNPVQFAGRFLVAPLVTIVEGFVLLRPDMTVRMGVGLTLLAAGAGYLLVSRGPGEDASLSLR